MPAILDSLCYTRSTFYVAAAAAAVVVVVVVVAVISTKSTMEYSVRRNLIAATILTPYCRD